MHNFAENALFKFALISLSLGVTLLVLGVVVVVVVAQNWYVNQYFCWL